MGSVPAQRTTAIRLRSAVSSLSLESTAIRPISVINAFIEPEPECRYEHRVAARMYQASPGSTASFRLTRLPDFDDNLAERTAIEMVERGGQIGELVAGVDRRLQRE